MRFAPLMRMARLTVPSGQTTPEYAVIVGFVVAGLGGIARVLGPSITSFIRAVGEGLAGLL
jgi:Flp pilus assembly pilin Flp